MTATCIPLMTDIGCPKSRKWAMPSNLLVRSVGVPSNLLDHSAMQTMYGPMRT